MKKLLGKDSRYVAKYMYKYGYIVADNYEDNNNHIAEFAKVGAGVTFKTVIITFNSKWKVIKVS